MTAMILIEWNFSFVFNLSFLIKEKFYTEIYISIVMFTIRATDNKERNAQCKSIKIIKKIV